MFDADSSGNQTIPQQIGFCVLTSAYNRATEHETNEHRRHRCLLGGLSSENIQPKMSPVGNLDRQNEKKDTPREFIRMMAVCGFLLLIVLAALLIMRVVLLIFGAAFAGGLHT
jgi:hypothetical protein